MHDIENLSLEISTTNKKIFFLIILSSFLLFSYFSFSTKIKLVFKGGIENTIDSGFNEAAW
ncbi:hypothetical protein BCY86_00205 [Pajaroellobacter abortibovis]|uniref:Uncharacterized protein n=1 Tax=Pajaroellobacter abortibovis TaxID=1882918 RepID=A0A1L6MUT0_9BACT|nr:hypothetical protein BCY86_00205 [Pajaroellobacter abortibovis]